MMALHSEKGHLKPTAPFDFAKSLEFLARLNATPNRRVAPAETTQPFTRAVSINGQVVAFQIASTGVVEEPELEYTLLSEQPIDVDTRRAAIDRITLYLSLDDDLRPFYEIGLDDPDFAPIIERLYGYHQVKFLTPFENACWAILTQRNPMAIARNMKEELTHRYGAALAVDGEIHWAFPNAPQIAAAGPDELLATVRNERRTEYLYAAAEAFAGVDETWLRSGPFEEVERWLRGTTGIGAWSASFILLRGLGRMERLPLGEARLGQAVSRVYISGRPAGEADIERCAAPYGPWRGYWAHYLRVAG